MVGFHGQHAQVPAASPRGWIGSLREGCTSALQDAIIARAKYEAAGMVIAFAWKRHLRSDLAHCVGFIVHYLGVLFGQCQNKKRAPPPPPPPACRSFLEHPNLRLLQNHCRTRAATEIAPHRSSPWNAPEPLQNMPRPEHPQTVPEMATKP